MITTLNSHNQKWIDITSPSKEEIDSLVISEGLDPIIARDLTLPTPRQYAKTYDNALYSVIHIPYFRNKSDENNEQEIDFVITERGLITARYESVDALHHFAKELEVEEILHKKNSQTHLFFGLMREIYTFLFYEIEFLKDSTKEIEKKIFRGFEKEMVFRISEAGRNILTFERLISSHQIIFNSLKEFGRDKNWKGFEEESSLLLEDWQRLMQEIENTSKILDELRETNNSILSTKQNEVMKIFTILAFVTFPLSLVASIFGMNTEYIPLVGLPNDFWIVMVLMTIMSIAMFIYFKYKRWM